jgi:hypothetical protein
LERLKHWEIIWRMAFNFWGIPNPHTFDFRGLPGFAQPGLLIVRFVSSLIKATVERKTDSLIMIL